MAMTRDSWLWWMLMLGSVFGYLATAPPPIDWTWQQGCNAAVVVLGILAGYLRQSPLKKSEDGSYVTPPPVAVLLPFVIAPLLLTGCGHKPPDLDPTTAKMYDANEVVKRINRLMDSAIEAEANKGLTEAQARVIIRFCVNADKSIARYPEGGWQGVVVEMWAKVKDDPLVKGKLAENQYVGTAFTLVDLALAFLGQPKQEALCSRSFCLSCASS